MKYAIFLISIYISPILTNNYLMASDIGATEAQASVHLAALQAVDDASVARRIQEEVDEAKLRRERENREEEAQSLETITALQNALGGDERGWQYLANKALDGKAWKHFKDVQPIAESMRVFPLEGNVHAFILASMGGLGVVNSARRATIMRICADFELKNNYSFDEIVLKMRKAAGLHTTPGLETSINMFRKHITNPAVPAIEPESQTNPLYVLSMCWNLCEKLSIKEYSGDIISCMSENIEGQGGCYAGFAGRIFRGLVFTLLHATKN